MTLRDALGLAFRNLRQARLRTALTTLGVAIGIASLSGMVSLGVGLQDQFVERFTRSGMFDSISVTVAQPGAPNLLGGNPGGRGGGRGGRGRGSRQPDVPSRTLDDAAILELAALPNVRDVYPTVRVPVELRFEDHTEFVTAAGVPMSARGEGAFQSLAHGAFFPAGETGVCMLSLDMVHRITERDPAGLVGERLGLTYAVLPAGGRLPAGAAEAMAQVERIEASCRITGIVARESGPVPAGPQVSGLMLPMADAQAIYQRIVSTPRALFDARPAARTYPSLTVRVTQPQHTQDVQAAIRALGYGAFSLNDALEGAKRAFLILDIVLSLIGSIALAVSALGIMNTMVMSILERTREIGIMKAIGGSDADIRRIFLIEAAVIGLMGGVAGVLLGWVVGRAINFGANQYIVSQGGAPGNLFSLPIWLIAAAIGFSILVSLAAGSYPARRAARLEPIAALRHD